MKKAPKQKKRGRPTGYKPEYCQVLIEAMSRGLSLEATAGEIGVCARSIHNWLGRYPEFMQAKKIGEAKSQLFWENMGIEGTLGKIKYFNCAAWIFNMKNRFKWRDKIDIDQTMKLEPIIIETDNRTITMEMGESLPSEEEMN